MIPRETTFWRGPCFFILPCLIVYVVFLMVPLLGTLGLSLTRWDGISFAGIRFIGLRNYKDLLYDSVFWLALRNTLIFVAGAVVFQCTLGLVVALLLEYRLRVGNFLRGTYFIPAITSLVVIGVIFECLLNPTVGVLDKFLKAIGLQRLAGFGLWLGMKKRAIWVLTLIQVWYGFGWSMFIFVSRLKSIDPQLYEAARIDGATGWQEMLYVTLPLLRGAAAVAVLFAAMTAMKIFTLPFIMTRGGPYHATEVLATWAYRHGLSFQHLGYGSAIAVMLVVFGIVLGFFIFKFTMTGRTEG